jgi:UDP-3-O-[3-hydroxymyristoyl] N-acetylglucosamine deacetylase/3-hydroxyacyl-[acyl-carrier-protein] dehydratase
LKQQTISKPVELEGRGLFTGEPATLRFQPAEPNAGLHFVRIDHPEPSRIDAVVENVAKRARRTALRNGTVAIETVEHCLSACAGLGIDNLRMELTGNELPAMDGSCLPFVEALQNAGIAPQAAPRDPFVVTSMVRVVDGDSELVALPALQPEADRLEIMYDLDYGHDTIIGRQIYSLAVTPEIFAREIAPARTFVLKQEADQLLAMGLGTHLTYDDILVFGPEGVIENELRFPDECVRHKILDLLGDLMLLGRFIVGRVYARKSGHSLNQEMVRRLAEQLDDQRTSSLLVSPPLWDIHRIQRILPHRYPFLMVDRIVELDGMRRAVGIKNVTINEEFFTGHYPRKPIMPGVLIIEAMAQMGGILLSEVLEHKGMVAILLSLDKVKFRRPVVPGDQLILTAQTVRVQSRRGHVRCNARVGKEMVCEAEIRFALTDAEPA